MGGAGNRPLPNPEGAMGPPRRSSSRTSRRVRAQTAATDSRRPKAPNTPGARHRPHGGTL